MPGLIDHRNTGAKTQSLAAELGPNSDMHVDVTHLEFSEVSSIKTNVNVARTSAAGSLIDHGLPEAMVRVMVVVGSSDLPTLVMDGQ